MGGKANARDVLFSPSLLNLTEIICSLPSKLSWGGIFDFYIILPVPQAAYIRTQRTLDVFRHCLKLGRQAYTSQARTSICIYQPASRNRGANADNNLSHDRQFCSLVPPHKSAKMDPNEQPPSMPDAPDKEKMEQV